MADNKKYYYLKLKDNFYDSDEIVILESMPEGHLYSNILLKLYLKSIKNEGKLMFNERIPYNPTILAQVTRHKQPIVEKALELFMELGLIEIMSNGAIYMLDIQNFIGKSSTEADRKREYRKHIEVEKGQMSGQIMDKTTPEIEKRREKKSKVKKKKLETDNNNSIGFTVFWDKYKKQIGKKECYDYFMELKSYEVEKILETVDKYVEVNNDKNFRKNPINYLKGECWNDEIITDEEQPKVDHTKLTKEEKFKLLENYNLGG